MWPNTSSGSLLDDLDLMVVLSHTKETAARVNSRRAEVADAVQRLAVARDVYKCVARRGSMIYFSSAAMSDAMPVYQVRSIGSAPGVGGTHCLPPSSR